MGANYMDDIECGSFFDTIDDLLDVPTEDITGNGSPVDGAAFPSLWFDNPSEGLLGCDSVFSGNNSASDLSAELSVPSEDIAQLEWLSQFVEESFSCESSVIHLQKQTPTMAVTAKDSSTPNRFRTSSPISVLESSNSCSMAGKTLPRSRALDTDVLACAKPGRARSKRGRPATFKPRPAFQLLCPAFSTGESPVDHSFPRKKLQKPAAGGDHEKKKKKIKLSVVGPHPPTQTDASSASAAAAQGVRKCLHCEITKTPQWRGGPMGPKTLCNACGVRYKSGRLFPEYRPAASPTFVPSVHSNSHKKVLEMRTKTGEVFPPLLDTVMMPMPTISPDTIAVTATPTSAAVSQSEVSSHCGVQADWM